MRKIANDSDINRTRYIVAIQSLSPSIRERIVGRERGAFGVAKHVDSFIANDQAEKESG